MKIHNLYWEIQRKYTTYTGKSNENTHLILGNPTEKLVKLSQAKWTGVPRQSFILNGNHVSVSVGSGLILFLKSISHMYVYVHKQVH